jgi:hypothetical protein
MTLSDKFPKMRKMMMIKITKVNIIQIMMMMRPSKKHWFQNQNKKAPAILLIIKLIPLQDK